MKKILLASTILAGTAGFAAADNANFTFSGSAYVGLAFVMGVDEAPAVAPADADGDGKLDLEPAGVDVDLDGLVGEDEWGTFGVGEDLDEDGVTGETDVTVFTPEVSAEFTVGMMQTTDGGLEVGANITIVAASIIVESDHTEGNFGDRETNDNGVNWDGAVNGTEGEIESASVYLSGDWGTFTATLDGSSTDYETLPFVYDVAIFDIAADVDFEYNYSFGDFDIYAWYEYRYGMDNDEYGLEGTYNFADYSIWAGFEYQQDLGVDGGYDVWFGASASINGFSGEAEVNYEDVSDDFDWYAKASYTVDAFTFGAIVEDDGVDDDIDYGVNASYALGGGASIDAAYIYDNDSDRSLAKAGVSMSF